MFEILLRKESIADPRYCLNQAIPQFFDPELERRSQILNKSIEKDINNAMSGTSRGMHGFAPAGGHVFVQATSPESLTQLVRIVGATEVAKGVALMSAPGHAGIDDRYLTHYVFVDRNWARYAGRGIAAALKHASGGNE